MDVRPVRPGELLVSLHGLTTRLARRPIVPVALTLALVVGLVTSLASAASGAGPARETSSVVRTGPDAGLTRHARGSEGEALPVVDALEIDPAAEPIPELELSSSAQSIVLLLEVTGSAEARLLDAAVSLSAPPARLGGPPLMRIQAFDGTGALVDSYNDWHPLWAEVHGDTDGEGEDSAVVIQDIGIARLIVRFDRSIETVSVTDIVDEERPIELIAIDARPIIDTYCAEHADDPACAPDEGCGPGYWWQHTAPWTPTGYTRAETVGSVFSNPSESAASASLHEALGFRGGRGPGGAERALLRQAVAALLNAAHPMVGYALPEADVIALVDAAIEDGRAAMLGLATELDELNALVCPIDADGQPTQP